MCQYGGQYIQNQENLILKKHCSRSDITFYAPSDCFFSSDTTDAVDSALAGGGFVASVTPINCCQ